MSPGSKKNPSFVRPVCNPSFYCPEDQKLWASLRHSFKTGEQDKLYKLWPTIQFQTTQLSSPISHLMYHFMLCPFFFFQKLFMIRDVSFD